MRDVREKWRKILDEGGVMLKKSCTGGGSPARKSSRTFSKNRKLIVKKQKTHAG